MLFARTWSRPSRYLFQWLRPGIITKPLVHRLSSGLGPIRLRDYQEECIKSVLSYLGNGHKRLGISLATGSGKTVIFTQLIDRIPLPNKDATQTLILAHRRELVEQAARHCTNAYPTKTVDIELGKNHASGTADITIASVQSLKSKDRIQKYDPARFKLLLVDEAHHIVAPQYLDVLEHFGLRPLRDGAPALVGVSATFSRFDGLKLGTAIDHIVYHRDYVDMINDGWLSDVMFTTVRLQKANLEKVALGANGDFLASALSQEVNNEENNEATVRTWLSRCSERHSTIVFCIDVQHIHDLAATFQRHGIASRFVTGDTPQKIRSANIEDFKTGKFPVLLNCGVFTEGTDIPNIDCVFLVRPTKSRNLLVQMIGRGMRLHPGKTNCHVIDMVSSLRTGVVTAPTLYGLDPDELVENATPNDLGTLKERKEKETAARRDLETISPQDPTQPSTSLSSTTLSFVDYDSVADLIEDTSGERHIRVISRYAWVQTQDDCYVLVGPTGSYIRLIKEEDGYHVRYVAKLVPRGRSPYARPRTILARQPAFEDAVHSADAFAEKTFPFSFIDRHQAWRRQPATEAQVGYLNQRRGEAEELTSETVTKGRAVDMITKLKFGARGRYEKIRSAQKRAGKAEKAVSEAEERKLREIVRVGPLEE